MDNQGKGDIDFLNREYSETKYGIRLGVCDRHLINKDHIRMFEKDMAGFGYYVRRLGRILEKYGYINSSR